MSKKFFFSLILTFAFFLLPFLVTAQKPEDWEPPEKNGVYDVPGKQGLKVRVFVHEPKIKPTQTSFICQVDNNTPSTPVKSAGWKLPTNDWNWYLNTSNAPSSISVNLKTIADNSIKTWQDELVNKVNLKYIGTIKINKKAYDQKNIIAWGRAPGTALGVTYIWYNSQTSMAVETDTIMNLKFPWGWSTDQCNSSYYDAQNILTHELGHWVGLDDEYDSAVFGDHTMYGYGSKGEIKKDTLTTGDKNGLASIYP